MLATEYTPFLCGGAVSIRLLICAEVKFVLWLDFLPVIISQSGKYTILLIVSFAGGRRKWNKKCGRELLSGLRRRERKGANRCS